MKTQNRELWLTRLAKELERLFKTAGAPKLPAYRVTCGWPSRKALTRKNKTIGQCFDKSCSKDKTTELIISMYIDKPLDAAQSPELDCPVAASAREQTPCPTEGNRMNPARMPPQGLDLRARVHRPQLHRAVRTSAGKQPAVRAEGD